MMLTPCNNTCEPLQGTGTPENVAFRKQYGGAGIRSYLIFCDLVFVYDIRERLYRKGGAYWVIRVHTTGTCSARCGIIPEVYVQSM